MLESTIFSYNFSIYKNLLSINKPEYKININQFVEFVKHWNLKKKIEEK